MIKRKIENKLEKALKQFRILMLNGPRQSGKTTLIKHIAKKSNFNYITLDDPNKLKLAKNDPKNFIDFFVNSLPTAIDEVQYAPELIPYLKIYVDEHNNKGMFLLTGSADFFKMNKITESLSGRMVKYNLYPLSCSEIRNKNFNIIDSLFDKSFFKLTPYLKLKDLLDEILTGGYPEIISIKENLRQDWFNSYIESRIQKDILEFKHISFEKLHKIKQLLQILSSMNSGLLNYNSIAKKIQLDNKTVLSYTELLEAMYIIKRIPAYHNNNILKVVKSHKIHFIDSALSASLLNINKDNLLNNKNDYYGKIIENFVFTELLKESTYSKNKINIYHFRDLRKNEVDLVLESQDGSIIAVEIKAKTNIKNSDLKGLFEIANKSKDKFLQGIIFYGGDEIVPVTYENFTFYLLPLGILG